ncbi:MAG: cytochrome-c peroxidase [Bdellovibrio sp.]
MLTQINSIIIVFLAVAVFAEAKVKVKDEPIKPIELPKNINVAKAELGKKLFFDPRLSKSGFISCNSCHNLSMGGSDNLKSSIGHNWQKGPINSPTVLNSSLNFAQFWDGRAKTLKEQAGGPIANPREMAFTHDLAIAVVSSINGYREEFKKIFGSDKIDIDKVSESIAEFEKTLVTPNSRFDKWLKGDDSILSEKELAGYKLFKEAGCIACHNGVNVGGGSFQKMGVTKEYITENTSIGRAGVTGKDADRMFFKVPTLRNVEMTYPYFHDGAADTLDRAVETMGKLQLGREFTTEEKAKIVAFLRTLTGDQPNFKIPILPISSDTTPRPQPFEK